MVNRFNLWVRGEEWADADFESWSRNLRLGWEWDENAFPVNMFGHPYQGGLYFNAGRSNCLSFWEAVPITFLGSWTWEYFGETFRPSMNDFFMTSFGGVALGELFHRLAVGIRDEESFGTERISREIAGLLVDPVGGLNRLARGQWRREGINPPDRLPDTYLFRIKAGARRVREARSPIGAEYSPTLLVEARLGDDFATEYERPYDVFTVLSQASLDGKHLNLFRATGRLYRAPLGRAGRHQLHIHQRFEYVSNPAYQFGEQSFQAGIASRWGIGDRDLTIQTRVVADLVPLGAIDAPDAGVGERTNDFGPGLGAGIALSLVHDDDVYVSFYNRLRYIRSVSGAPANHTVLFSGLDVALPISPTWGLGIYLSGDERRSRYAEAPDDLRSYLETRLYLTWTPASSRGGPS